MIFNKINFSQSWSFNVNRKVDVFDSSGDFQRRYALFLILDSFLSTGNNPWTVSYSCDSVNFGTPGDGVNYITSYEKIIARGSTSTTVPRSWIVINRGNGDGTQLLFHFDSQFAADNSYRFSLSISPGAGFTGGNTTTAPTATDQHVIFNQGDSSSSGKFNIEFSEVRNQYIHYACTNDGKYFWLTNTIQNGSNEGDIITSAMIRMDAIYNTPPSIPHDYSFTLYRSGDIFKTDVFLPNSNSFNRINLFVPQISTFPSPHQPSIQLGHAMPIGIHSTISGDIGFVGNMRDVYYTSDITNSGLYDSASILDTESSCPYDAACWRQYIVPWPKGVGVGL